MKDLGKNVWFLIEVLKIETLVRIVHNQISFVESLESIHTLNLRCIMSDPRLKKLRIATGVVKRCGKEKLSYRKEADMQRDKIEKMKTEGRDEIEIRKMNEVSHWSITVLSIKLNWLGLQCMQESLMMIPDCHRRLEKAINDLKPLFEELEGEFPESTEVTDAKAALEASDEHLKAEWMHQYVWFFSKI